MILHSLTIAQKVLQQLEVNESKLSAALEKTIYTYLDSNTEALLILNQTTIQQAINLTNYCFKHKLILSGYHIDPIQSLDTTLGQIINQFQIAPTIHERFSHLDSSSLTRIRRTLFSETTYVEPVDITHGNDTHGKVPDVVQTFQLLQRLELGQCKEVNSGHKFTVFQKYTANAIQQKPTVGQNIVDLGIDLNTFIVHLESTEAVEAADELRLKGQFDVQPGKIVKRKAIADPEEKMHEFKKRKLSIKQYIKINTRSGAPLVLPKEKVTQIITATQIQPSQSVEAIRVPNNLHQIDSNRIQSNFIPQQPNRPTIEFLSNNNIHRQVHFSQDTGLKTTRSTNSNRDTHNIFNNITNQHTSPLIQTNKNRSMRKSYSLSNFATIQQYTGQHNTSLQSASNNFINHSTNHQQCLQNNDHNQDNLTQNHLMTMSNNLQIENMRPLQHNSQTFNEQQHGHPYASQKSILSHTDNFDTLTRSHEHDEFSDQSNRNPIIARNLPQGRSNNDPHNIQLPNHNSKLSTGQQPNSNLFQNNQETQHTVNLAEHEAYSADYTHNNNKAKQKATKGSKRPKINANIEENDSPQNSTFNQTITRQRPTRNKNNAPQYNFNRHYTPRLHNNSILQTAQSNGTPNTINNQSDSDYTSHTSGRSISNQRTNGNHKHSEQYLSNSEDEHFEGEIDNADL